MKNHAHIILVRAVAITILLPLVIYAQLPALPKNFYKRFEGEIATPKKRQPIIVNLHRDSIGLYGTYCRNETGLPVNLKDQLGKNDEVFLSEVDKAVIIGTFEGKFTSESEITGTWQKAGTSDRYNFTLRESYPPGSVQLKINFVSREVKDQATNSSASVSLYYPEIINHQDKKIAQRINEAISDMVAIDHPETFLRVTLERMPSEQAKGSWSTEVSTKVMFNSEYILSLENYLVQDQAGINSSFTVTCTSFDLHTGKRVTLDDILVKDYTDRLHVIADRIFRKENGIALDLNLQNGGFWFQDGVFKLNTNYFITNRGIEFVYNPVRLHLTPLDQSGSSYPILRSNP